MSKNTSCIKAMTPSTTMSHSSKVQHTNGDQILDRRKLSGLPFISNFGRSASLIFCLFFLFPDVFLRGFPSFPTTSHLPGLLDIFAKYKKKFKIFPEAFGKLRHAIVVRVTDLRTGILLF